MKPHPEEAEPGDGERESLTSSCVCHDCLSLLVHVPSSMNLKGRSLPYVETILLMAGRQSD